MSNRCLTPISVNKTVVFYSPFESDEDVLVRTGVIESEDALLHAVLHAYSKTYAKADKSKRLKIVKKLMKETKEKNPLDNIREFYDYIKNQKGDNTIAKDIIKKEADIEIYKIISELIPIKDIDEVIFKNLKKNPDIALVYANEIFSQLGIDTKKKNYCTEKFVDLIESSFKNKKQKGDILEDKVGKDIFIFDSTARIPIEAKNLKGRKSILVMKFDNGHYEVIGKLLPGNKIQRVFSIDDSIIKKVRMYTSDRESFDKNYPEISDTLEDYCNSGIDSPSTGRSSSQEEEPKKQVPSKPRSQSSSRSTSSSSGSSSSYHLD
jgi:hypothetical protein